ncbi:MAG: lysylphosphatidylglycerol synthase transmembrane domain-containing protein [Verrucomicrobiota bacterium]
MVERAESEPKSNRSKLIRSVLIRFAVVGLLIGLVLGTNQYDWEAFGQEFSNAHTGWLVGAFLFGGVIHLTAAWRWVALLRVQDIDLPYLRVLKVNLIGFFFNQFLPSTVGGDAVKIFYAMRQTPGKKAKAALSMIMDRVLGLLSILCVTLILIPFEWERLSADPNTKTISLTLAVMLGCLFMGLFVAAVFPLNVLPQAIKNLWPRVPKRDIFETLYEGFQAHKHYPLKTTVALVAAVATVIPVLGLGSFISHALHLDIGVGPMTILFALVLCAMSVPLPGGHGMREGAFVLLFPIFNVTRDGIPVGDETALACSTLFLAITIFWALIGGGIYLLFSHQLKAENIEQ